MDQEVAKTLGELELKLQELERELTSIGRRDTHEESPRTAGKLIDEAVERELESHGDTQRRAGEETASEGEAFGGPAVFGGEEVPAQAGATIERDWTVEVRETAYGEIPTPPSPTPQPPSPVSSPPAPTPPPPSVPSPPAPTPQPPSSVFSPPAPTPQAPSPVFSPPARTPQPPPSAPRDVRSPSSPPGWRPPPNPPDPRRPDAVEESRSVDLAELVRFRDKLASTMDELIDEYSRLLPAEAPWRRRSDA